MTAYGYIKISRKLFHAVDGDVWWQEPRVYSHFEAWVYLIQLAQWAPGTLSTQYGPVALERGEFVASIRHLAKDWKWGVQRVRTFLKKAKNLTRLQAQRETQSGTVYLIVNYDTYQGSDDDDNTPDNTAKSTALTQRQHKNKNNKQLSITTTSYPADFELLWNAYPKRSGSNNKQAAYRQFEARLAEGVSFQAMHDGVLRYAAWATASGKVGTELVKMASTFLGRDRHFADAWDIPAASDLSPRSERSTSRAITSDMITW